MNVVVFGASGTCGSHFVRLAAARGHRVSAVVRESTRFEASGGVTVLRGNVLDPAFVAESVRGHDTVMSGLGLRYKHFWAKRESPDDFISRATRHVIAGMKAAGIARISVISVAGIGDSRPGLNISMRLLVAVSNVGKAYADLERVETELRSSGLDWQAVRPVTLTYKPGTGRWRFLDRYPATATIPREDVAAFILRELESPQFTSRTPIIAGAAA